MTTDGTDPDPITDETTIPMPTKKKTLKKAFDVPRGSIYMFDPDELVIIGLDTKHASLAEHHLWDKRAKLPVDEEFVLNIAAKGIETPIIVVKLDDQAVVVAGRQRVKAARTVNEWRAKRAKDPRPANPANPPDGPPLRVPARMMSGTELELMGSKTTENAARRDMDMVDKAAEAQAMIARGATKEQVARDFAVTTKAIENWIALAGASRPVREAVLAGKIPATAAAKIARLASSDAQAEALEEVVAAGRATKQAAQAAVNKRRPNGKHTGGIDGADGVGLTSRKDQKRLLAWLGSGEQNERSVYWDGVADALKVVLGEKGADQRIKKAVKKALRAEA